MPYSRSRTPSKDNVNIDPYIFLPLYWGARDRNEESFMYEGQEVLVAYAFYMIQAAGWADVTPEELSQGDDYPAPSHFTEDEQKVHLAGHHSGPTTSMAPRTKLMKDSVEERHRQIVEYALHNPKFAHWEIAEHFGLKRGTVQQILARAGQTRVRRGRKINPESKAAQYHAFWLEHPELTYEQIGHYFSVGAGVIHRSIRNYEAALSAEEIRQPRGGGGGRGDIPSHYTAKTPEGALEAMERRLSGGFSEQMAEALAQMELKVGELAEAVSRMGTSVPAPIVEAAEAVEEAAEVVEAVATGRGRGRPRDAKAQAIRDHILALGARAGQENTESVAKALRERFPDITGRDVQNAIRMLPGGSPLGRKPMVRSSGPPSGTSMLDFIAREPRPERRYGF